MYSVLLGIHSWLRWVVLILGVIAVVRAVTGRRGRPWSGADNGIASAFVGTFDLQLLIGLLLYVWLSPVTQSAFDDFGAAMRNPQLRFFAVEHIVGMLVANVLAHVGRVKIRKASGDARRHGVAALFFGLALIIILASIPWPGMPAGRELFPGF